MLQNKALPSVAADIIGAILIAVILSPLLGPFLRNPTVRGGSILFFGLILAGLAFNQIKRLEPVEGYSAEWLTKFNFSSNQRLLLTLAVILVTVFVLMQANLNNLWGDTVDLFENTGEVHEGEMTLYITFGPIFIWFMAGALFLAGFALQTEKVIPAESSAYPWTEFIGLLIVNLLLGLFALFFVGWFARFFPSLSTPISFILVWGTLELLFIPLRLRHTFRNPQVASIASFLVLIFVATWATM